MKKIKVLKLGIECKDQATGLKGMLTHWICESDETIRYMFQPRGLNPETGAPVDKIWLDGDRIKEEEKVLEEEVDIPVNILGSIVTDAASGFSGTAISLIRHINGCFHVAIQPSGVLPKTNSSVKPRDFDLRQCRGDEIPVHTEEELKESRQNRPSPDGEGFGPDLPSSGSILD